MRAKNVRTRFAAALLSASALVSGCSGGDAAVAAGAKIQREYTAQRGDITVGVEAEGTVTAQVAALDFDYDAVVEEIHVAPGQKVLEGDPLITLAADSIQTSIKEKSLEVSSARLAVSKLAAELEAKKLKAYHDYQVALTYEGSTDDAYDASVDSLKRKLEDLEDRVEELNEARYDRKDERKDAKDEYGSESTEYEAADEAYAAAYKEYRTALDELEALYREFDRTLLGYAYDRDSQALSAKNAQAVYDNTINSLSLESTRATQELETLSEDLEKLNEILKDSMLKAPADGIVLTVDCKVGDKIKSTSSSSSSSSQSRQLASVMKLQSMEISSAVAQEDIIGIEMGHEVMITLDMYEDTPLTGSVSAISLSPVNQNGNVAYTVTTSFEPGGLTVYGGMTGELNFIVKQKQDVLYIQNRAVSSEGGRQYVHIKNEDGTTTKTEIKTGFSDGKVIEILEGMAQGQTAVSER